MSANQTHYNPITLTLNSDDANVVDQGQSSSCMFHLNNPISPPNTLVDALLTLTGLQIPRTWYDVTEANNKLAFALEPNPIGYTVLTLKPGIYNARNYATALVALFVAVDVPTMAISYDSITNHFLFIAGVGTELTFFQNGTTMFEQIGFSFENGDVLGEIIESDRAVDLSGTRYVKLDTNIPTNNLDSSKGFSSSRSLATVLVSVPPLGIMTYIPLNPIPIRIQNIRLSNIEVQLMDDHERLLVMNGGRWACTIQLVWEYRPIVYYEQDAPELTNQHKKLRYE